MPELWHPVVHAHQHLNMCRAWEVSPSSVTRRCLPTVSTMTTRLLLPEQNSFRTYHCPSSQPLSYRRHLTWHLKLCQQCPILWRPIHPCSHAHPCYTNRIL